MKSIRKWILEGHRFLGAVLSVLLLVWFLSGFVMIYHRYPSWKAEEALANARPIDPSILLNEGIRDSLLGQIKGVPNENSYTLYAKDLLPYNAHYELRGSGKTFRYDLRGKMLVEESPRTANFDAVAALWQDSVLSVDTLEELDQWTPFSRLRKDLPFYRLRLSKEGREVYLSSLDGRIITEHTRAERLWSWLGPIPHWVYFTWIRQNADLWVWLIIVLSGFGVLMTIAGIYIGIDVYWRTRRTHKGIHSPYKKHIYRWHHILGTLGGIFIFSWCFSGLMSVVDITERVNHPESSSISEHFSTHTLPPNKYNLSSLPSTLPSNLKEIQWSSFGSIPLIRLAYGDRADSIKHDVYKVEQGRMLPLELKEQEVRDLIGQTFPTKQSYTLELLDEYDDYYISRDRGLPLPVYRAIPTDSTLPYIYVGKYTGQVRILPLNRRIGAWLYSKTHSFKFVFLVSRPVLWTLVMWGLLIVGTVVSLTGLLMALRYFRRCWR